MAEGKQHALSVGITQLSTDDMYVFIVLYYIVVQCTLTSRLKINKGVGVENVHYLCDGLWLMKNAHR